MLTSSCKGLLDNLVQRSHRWGQVQSGFLFFCCLFCHRYVYYYCYYWSNRLATRLHVKYRFNSNPLKTTPKSLRWQVHQPLWQELLELIKFTLLLLNKAHAGLLTRPHLAPCLYLDLRTGVCNPKGANPSWWHWSWEVRSFLNVTPWTLRPAPSLSVWMAVAVRHRGQSWLPATS